MEIEMKCVLEVENYQSADTGIVSEAILDFSENCEMSEGMCSCVCISNEACCGCLLQ